MQSLKKEARVTANPLLLATGELARDRRAFAEVDLCLDGVEQTERALTTFVPIAEGF